MDLKSLCLLRGPSGNEQAVRRAIIEAATPLCDEVKLDRMGNVLAYKKGTGEGKRPVVQLSAHMDEVGLIVTSATEDGFLRIRPVGGVDSRVIISKRVLVGEKAVPGIIGAKAIHLQTRADRESVLDYDGIYVDIGAKDQADAYASCPQGSYVTFDSPYIEFGEGMVCARALDDRVGCFALLELLRGDYPCDIVCSFVSQEELGLRGAAAAGYTIQPDMAIVLEGTTANDLGDVPDVLKVCRVGGGVAVSFMDGASIACKPLYQAMLGLAEREGIPCQIKQAVAGGNDAGAIQRSGVGIRTVVLSVPCRYIHSPSSVIKYSDVESQIALCRAFLMNGAQL